jgi:predicted AAA+ superfamily ATPase
MIDRHLLIHKIQNAFKVNRIVCLLGPRQCGKTTLARILWNLYGKEPQSPGYFDLEKPLDIQMLETPELTLRPLKGLIIIDEIQRRPNLFPFLRYLYDENLNQQFLILGSASRQLIHQASESLAGRISFIEITPFSLQEVFNQNELWTKGGFPNSYLKDNGDSFSWRQEYIRTYIEQDLGTFGLSFNPDVLRRMWFMLAHYHGQIFNASEIGQSLGVSHPTIRRYLSYLQETFMMRTLNPWFANIKKRQVKSPKVYFRDSGLLHHILGIKKEEDLLLHPKVGASWEGFALEEICRLLEADTQDSFFWASHNQAELDLLILKNGKKIGFEFKYQDAPKITPSMKIAMEDLELDCLHVIYPGSRDYRLTEKIDVYGLTNYIKQYPIL